MDSYSIPRTLPDFEYVIIPESVSYDASLAFDEASLYEEVLPELMLRAVVKEDAKTNGAQAIVEIYNSEELKTRVEVINEETAQTYWIIPE